MSRNARYVLIGHIIFALINDCGGSAFAATRFDDFVADPRVPENVKRRELYPVQALVSLLAQVPVVLISLSAR